MKKNIIITIIGTIIILLSINSNESSNNNASALTYSNNVDLEYTFAPTLDVSFSSNNGSSFNGFVIEDLTPGTAAYSNTVTVTASSNNSDGFTMSATVGKDSSVDSYRNNSRLVHSNNTNYFESIATNANLSLDNLGTNKWGYAICEDNNNNSNNNSNNNDNNNTNSGGNNNGNNECSTWSNYNGLPVIGTAENPTTGTTLAETDSAGSTSVDMRIGASSTNTQVSGTFTNDINFTITAKIVTYDYTISYNANDGNPTTTGNNTVDTTNMPSNTNGSLETGQTLQTSAIIPTRAKYTFLGWCDGIVTNLTCNGNTYQTNDYIKIANASSSSANNITLKAIWGLRLYDQVASMTKGTQSIADIRAAIDAPDETESVSTNSGVYTYNATVFGTSSDASNDYPIYYYRGILDSYGNTGTYGSDGLADAYPNYVKLGNNTCWRIIRTTGSGGVKMIYNGTYGATTAGSCANPTENAQTTSAYFGAGTPGVSDNYYGTKGFVAYWGYNYNPDYAYNHTELTSPVDNSVLFTNNAPSNIRNAVETWYANNMAAYTDMLEGSAGFCNDRTTYTSSNVQTTSTIPYALEELRPGPYVRVATSGSTPSYNCPNSTGYDLLTVGDGLGHPVALITADEAALAGSGWSNNGSSTPYSANSFLRSGSNFWSLSPSFRYSDGVIGVFYVGTDGDLGRAGVYASDGVRPAISFTTGTIVASGTGVATDPWIIAE